MAIKKDTLDGLLAGHDPQAVFAKEGARGPDSVVRRQMAT
jgi:hypothetical protein